MSHPWLSQPMVYGCGCGVVDKFNLLMTSTEIRLFWLPLSTMKCSGVPFTHIYEWKRHSPSSGSSGSSGWTFVVVTRTLGSTSMIHFPLSISESDLNQGLTLRLSVQPPMISLSDIHQCCARGFCGAHTISQCPSSSHYLSFLVAWTSYPEVGYPFSSFVL
jgi:hypothetical protein